MKTSAAMRTVREARVLALALVALAVAAQAGVGGCLRVEHGIVVELALSALPTGAATTVWSEDGTELALDTGEITVTEARLLVCRGDATARVHDLWRALVVPSRALAQHDHGASPLVIVGPFRVSLVGAPTVLGLFDAPPGRYCAVHIALGPARDVADGAPWTLAIQAHTAAGLSVAAASDGPGIAHVELAEPLVLDRAGTTRLHASLFLVRPFAQLTGLAAGSTELGAAILRGAASQGALVEERLVPSSTAP